MNMLKRISLNSMLKKSLALFVALVILISTLTVALVASAAGEEFWDGSKADNYAGGTGTQADPYIIEDGSQLLKMVKENIVAHSSVSSTQIKYFKITNQEM